MEKDLTAIAYPKEPDGDIQNIRYFSSLCPTDALYRFYVEYRNWVLAGLPDHEVFDSSHSLCHNLRMWKKFHNYALNPNLNLVQNRLFRAAGLNDCYPFEILEGATLFSADYVFEENSLARTHHLNKWRMQWVNEMILNFEEKYKKNV